jgi:hypothetical protein
MPMIDKATARDLVEAELKRLNQGNPDVEFVIVDDRTLEYDFGWVFFWNSRQFVETGDIRHALLGNAPLIVDKDDGTLHVTGTGRPTEEYVREFEENRNKR